MEHQKETDENAANGKKWRQTMELRHSDAGDYLRVTQSACNGKGPSKETLDIKQFPKFTRSGWS